MLEVIHCLPEQGDITKVTVLVLKEYTTQKENKPSVRINQVQISTDQSHSTTSCTLLLQGKDINVDNYTGFSSQIKHQNQNVTDFS